MIKTFVLDTNVLLHNPNAVEAFEDNTILLPMTVIEELDKFKTNNDERGRNARHVIRRLDALRRRGNLGAGVRMDNGGLLRITIDRYPLPGGELDPSYADNRILGVAYHLQQRDEKVIFVSKDINARIKADALGLPAQDFESQKVNYEALYTGVHRLDVESDVVDRFYSEHKVTLEAGLNANEFVLLRDMANPKHSAIGRAVADNGVVPLANKVDHVYSIKPRNKEQRMALDLLLDPRVQLVTLVGQAGSGKTLLALAAGLEAVLRKQMYDKILVSRPIIPMGKDIGYLPGDKEKKLSHWMEPIFDNLIFLVRDENGGKGGGKNPANAFLEELMRKEQLELEALTYIRGRSIPRQYVIVDEAQNLTPHEVKTIVSRAGEGTKMVLTGDPDQIDNPYLDSASNGLTYVVERMKGNAVTGHITLHKSERSALSALAASLL